MRPSVVRPFRAPSRSPSLPCALPWSVPSVLPPFRAASLHLLTLTQLRARLFGAKRRTKLFRFVWKLAATPTARRKQTSSTSTNGTEHPHSCRAGCHTYLLSAFSQRKSTQKFCFYTNTYLRLCTTLSHHASSLFDYVPSFSKPIAFFQKP